MADLRVPSTIDELVAGLDGLGKLLTAKTWERAAYVYAWTEPAVNQHSGGTNTGQQMSARAFAELGITGLKNRNTVNAYRKAWTDGGGDPDLKPGDAITLPTSEWKDNFGEATAKVQERVARTYIATHPEVQHEVFRKVVEDPDEVAKAVNQDAKAQGALVDSVVANKKLPGLKTVASARLAPPTKPTIAQPPRQAAPVDWDAKVLSALLSLADANRAYERGEWKPDSTSGQAIHFVGKVLEPWRVSGEASTDLMAELEDFLRKQGVRS